MSRKQIILGTISDLCQDFFYYDRKEDEELGEGEIEAAVEAGEITVEEITNEFKTLIVRGLETEN